MCRAPSSCGRRPGSSVGADRMCCRCPGGRANWPPLGHFQRARLRRGLDEVPGDVQRPALFLPAEGECQDHADNGDQPEDRAEDHEGVNLLLAARGVLVIVVIPPPAGRPVVGVVVAPPAAGPVVIVVFQDGPSGAGRLFVVLLVAPASPRPWAVVLLVLFAVPGLDGGAFVVVLLPPPCRSGAVVLIVACLRGRSIDAEDITATLAPHALAIELVGEFEPGGAPGTLLDNHGKASGPTSRKQEGLANRPIV